MLSVGTFGMQFISSFFLRVVPHSALYSSVPPRERPTRSNSNQLHRTRSGNSGHNTRRFSDEPGTKPLSPQELTSFHNDTTKDHILVSEGVEIPNSDADESSSLMSKSSLHSGPYGGDGDAKITHNPDHLDVRGVALLTRVEFWQLFSILGLLTGIGLMTIK